MNARPVGELVLAYIHQDAVISPTSRDRAALADLRALLAERDALKAALEASRADADRMASELEALRADTLRLGSAAHDSLGVLTSVSEDVTWGSLPRSTRIMLADCHARLRAALYGSAHRALNGGAL